MERTLSILTIFCFLLSYSLPADGQTALHSYSVRGEILEGPQKHPISFASIHIEELNVGTICDVDGKFEITKIPAGEYSLSVKSLGYHTKTLRIKVDENISLTIKLAASSIELPEYNVMAKRTKGDKLVIGESAIEYVQPISIADILVLLPGNIYTENSMTSFSRITSRQAGSDSNTSLGVGIIADGAPMDNDAMRTQMVGVTENSSIYTGDTQIKSRTGMNQGVDLRYISTDHIQSIEFTKGISSAKNGNLTSGAIQINSKYGVTPLRVRAKSDLKNKLIYVGKGFRLSEKAGTIHLGVDYLNSINDIREESDKFSRITAQAYYNNQVEISEKKLIIDAKISQTISVNKMKKDELTSEYNEMYKSDYKKTNILFKGNLHLNKPWLDKLELLTSADVVFDKINRHRMVISSSVLNVPLAKEEGEHEGLFLPGKYYSDFYIDNIPISLFSQLNATSRFNFNKQMFANIFYGIEYRNSKNRGDGAMIDDEERPPFPYDNSYMRPRRNKDIPAISVGAAYIQSEFTHIHNENIFKLSLGGRLTRMFNLDSSYDLSDKVLAEPRINLYYTLGIPTKKGVMKNTLRVGYGEENKLPTLDYLYPERLYKDFYMLNAYVSNAEYRRLITHTRIFDVVNTGIRENKNKKIEIGWDMEYNNWEVSLTAFMEKTKNGFEYFTTYIPLTYDLYEKLRPGVDISNRKPEKEDYMQEKYSIFTTSSKVMNSRKVTKKGIEYRIVFPQINVLYTRIEVNGAYYKTNYGTTLPEYYYPNKMIAGKVYPYVGLYNTNPQDEYHRFNTNIWLNTHIPQFKLMFTNFFQFIWIASNQHKDRHEEYPAEYMGFDGKIHPVDNDMLSQIHTEDATLRYLRRTISPLDYEKNSEPISIMWNIKATKEFNKYAKCSFFVNNIIDMNPKYRTGKKKTDRNWVTPFFGVELFFNISL